MSTQFFVLSNPKDGQEDAFNDWYEKVHLPEVCAIPGIVSAQRYEAATVEIPDNPMGKLPAPKRRYLATYTIESDPAAILSELLRRMGSGEMAMSDTMDLMTVDMAFWQPRGPRVEG